MQGAGGVGGLLCESNISNPLSPISYPTYDGNGNITEYLTANGSVAAHFEYDPFGNTVINTDITNQFTYKFSTKPQDVESGLYYYGYRYYDAVAGRWINRDPIEENGGVNLYGFIGNEPLGKLELLGLAAVVPIPIIMPFPPIPITGVQLGILGIVIEEVIIIGIQIDEIIILLPEIIGSVKEAEDAGRRAEEMKRKLEELREREKNRKQNCYLLRQLKKAARQAVWLPNSACQKCDPPALLQAKRALWVAFLGSRILESR
jgi:RHS repeat-associated protein